MPEGKVLTKNGEICCPEFHVFHKTDIAYDSCRRGICRMVWHWDRVDYANRVASFRSEA